MFSNPILDNKMLDNKMLDHDTRNPDGDVIPIRRSTPDRLAELVHHLGGVPMRDARRAVQRTDHTADNDPLSIVAAALLELRQNTTQNRCIGV